MTYKDKVIAILPIPAGKKGDIYHLDIHVKLEVSYNVRLNEIVIFQREIFESKEFDAIVKKAIKGVKK